MLASHSSGIVRLIGCRKGETQSLMPSGKEEQAEIAAKRYHQDKRNNPITDSRREVQKRIVWVLTNDFEEPYGIQHQIPAKGGDKYEN